MNETIISRHNERVKPDDTVFFLGDFIFKGGKEGGVHRYQLFEKRLNGKFIFVRGNHDNGAMLFLVEILQDSPRFLSSRMPYIQ
jgi:calcineurin-like phosphoesterase family protein